MERARGLAVEGLEINLPLHGSPEGMPMCAVTPRHVQGQVVISQGENRRLKGREGISPQHD